MKLLQIPLTKTLLLFILLLLIILSNIGKCVNGNLNYSNYSKWYWLREGAYAALSTNYSVHVLMNFSYQNNLMSYISLLAMVNISWVIEEIRGNNITVLFKVVLYNFSRNPIRDVVEIQGRGLKLVHTKNISLPDPYITSKKLVINLVNRSVYCDGKFVGEWHYFLSREDFERNSKIRIIKGYYVEFIARPPPSLEEYERIYGTFEAYTLHDYLESDIHRHLKKLGGPTPLTNFTVLSNITISLSRLGVLHHHVRDYFLYYDIVSGLLLGFILRESEYSDSILNNVFGINQFLALPKPKTLPPRPIPTSLKLVDTNIPLTRPVFGAIQPLEPKINLFLIIWLNIAICVLTSLIIYTYFKRDLF